MMTIIMMVNKNACEVRLMMMVMKMKMMMNMKKMMMIDGE